MARKQKKSKIRILMIVFLILLGIWFMFRLGYNAPLVFDENTQIEIQEWDTLAKFYSHLNGYHTFMMKLWLRNHKALIPSLQKGKYVLGGNYQKKELLEQIAKGPEKAFIRVTLLEGRSIYDIDQELTSKGLIQAWTFIAKANDLSFIQKLKSEFSFLSILPEGKSLEGFLYPDTYFLDQNWDLSEQLVTAQLKNFQQKIWDSYHDRIVAFWHGLSPYQVVILASVIENEEKTSQNKPIIAGIFLNRLEKGMKLDADVTLCYGLKVTYDKCRQNIVPNLSDANNPYNTRQVFGLMPTPISSPSEETLSALLNFQKTDYLFYLHDQAGGIHYGLTNEDHVSNVATYLR